MKRTELLLILINAVLIISSFGFLIFVFVALPPQVPLWYSLPWGEGQLASRRALFLLPTLSLLFFVINLLFPKIFKLKEDKNNLPISHMRQAFYRQSLIFTSFFCTVVNLITLVKIAGLFL